MSNRRQESIRGLQTVVLNSEIDHIEKCVILCHGFGAPGTDLVPIGEEMISKFESLKNTAFLFPAGPVQLDPDFDARAWWLLDLERLQNLMESGDHRDLKNESPPQMPICAQQIEDLINYAAKRFNIERSKIVIGGFSQGAMLTTHVTLTTNDPVGGLIIWSGALINQAIWKKSLENAPPTLVVQSHGKTDPVLPFENATELNALLNEQGIDASFHPFDGPHTISPVAMKEAAVMIGRI